MHGSTKEVVKNSIYQTFIGKKGELSVLPHISRSYTTNIQFLFAVFKKELLIALNVWLSRNQSSNSAVPPALPSPDPLQESAFAVLVPTSHSDAIDLCSPTLHASVVLLACLACLYDSLFIGLIFCCVLYLCSCLLASGKDFP